MSSPAVSRSSSEIPGVQPRPLRRLTVEIFGIVVLKLVALTLIWFVAFAPRPRPDASPAAVADRLAPASSAASGTQP